jgi:FixJ family two-component response regulator
MTVSVAIVDHDEDILDAVRMALEDIGWCVRTYSTGEDFLADVKKHRPDCLILDPHLPGLSGAEVARALTEDNRHIPIIGLTARPASLVTDELVNAGARVMLTKPATFEDLVEYVQAAITD